MRVTSTEGVDVCQSLSHFEFRSNSVWFVGFIFLTKSINSERLFIRGLLSPLSLRCFFFPITERFYSSFGLDRIHFAKWFRTANTSHQLYSLIKKKPRIGRINPSPCCWSRNSLNSIFIYLFSDTEQGFITTTGNTNMGVVFMKINCYCPTENGAIEHHVASVTHCFFFCK